MSLPAQICVGTYDGSVAGMTLTADDTPDHALALAINFAYHSHPAAVRAAALHGRTLATGGADETVRLYDLSRRVELGTLHHHSGTITALSFARDAARTLLFCAGADGLVSLVRSTAPAPPPCRTGPAPAPADWALFKELRAHHAPVAALAVHPSLNVLLSTAADRALYLWNLARGKVAFSVKTKGAHAHAAAWSPEGDRYVLAAARAATVSDVSGRAVSSLAHDTRVATARFLPTPGSHADLLTGADDGVVRRWDLRAPPADAPAGPAGSTGRSCAQAFTMDARVVDVHAVGDLVVAADSRGGLKIWDARRSGDPRIETVIGGANGVSLTCMTAAPAAIPEPPRASAPQEETVEKDANPDESAAKKKARPQDGMTASQRKRKKSKLRK